MYQGIALYKEFIDHLVDLSRHLFGSCFLTTNQSSNLGLGFIILGLFCLTLCRWTVIRVRRDFDRRTRKPTR